MNQPDPEAILQRVAAHDTALAAAITQYAATADKVSQAALALNAAMAEPAQALWAAIREQIAALNAIALLAQTMAVPTVPSLGGFDQ